MINEPSIAPARGERSVEILFSYYINVTSKLSLKLPDLSLSTRGLYLRGRFLNFITITFANGLWKC